MNKRSENRRNALLTVAAVLVALVAFNTVLAYVLPHARLDLTQDKLYSLSPGSRALLARLDEEVTLEFFWTKGSSADLPQVRAHAQRVKEFLEELRRLSGGKIRLRIVDPEPFSEAEDEARAAGLPALSVDGSGRTITLGLVARSKTDLRKAIPYLAPEQEPFLEYEVLKAIATVGRADKPSVGILSGMQLEGGADPRNQFQPRGAPVVIDELRELFKVQMIEPTAEKLPDGLGTLVLIQPRKLSEAMLHAIDEWAIAGKPLVVLADPYAETDQDPDARTLGAKKGFTTFDLGPLLAAWGVAITPEMVVGDRKHATRVQTRAPGGGVRELDYPAWLTLTRECFTKTDPIVGALNQINLMSAGAIEAVAGATSTLMPLIQTSDDAQFIQSLKLGFFGDPEQLIKDFVSDGKPKVLAARISGPIRRAFGVVDPPPPALPAAMTGNANILLVADADLVADQTWVVDAGSGNGKRAISDNGPFLVNAIELMAGDPALSQVRGRGSFRRPFHVVDALRTNAEAKSVAREGALQDEIRKAELRIGELQRERTPEGGQTLVLTPQQAQELNKLQEQMLAARKELRQLQLALRQAVESLGTWLLLLNTVIWPSTVAAVALLWYVVRGRGSRRQTVAVAGSGRSAKR